MPPKEFRERPEQYADFPPLGKVCRLGLATRGNTPLEPEDVLHAIDCGVNYLSWCTHPDGMSAERTSSSPRSFTPTPPTRLSAK